jgi:hypothetical protein
MAINREMGRSKDRIVFILMTFAALLKFPTCSFIKLCNQARGKQINTDDKACADKYINSEHPSTGESGVGNQPVEQKIIRDMLWSMGNGDENNIQQQQENAHCHTEQTDKRNKLPVRFKTY